MVSSLESGILTSELPLMEDFYTIQGEGFYQGHAAYFIRLGGCDVGCIWCDVCLLFEPHKVTRMVHQPFVGGAVADGS